MDTSRGVSERQAVRAVALPAGLAQMPPGAQLGVLLESVDRATVAAEQLLDLVRARARLLAQVQAELFADIVEAARGVLAPQGSLTRTGAVQWECGEVIGWALCYSSPYGAHQLHLAQALVQRLPMVLDALRGGRLDYGRASAIADALSEVDDDVARRIAQRLLDKGAQRMPLSSMREKAAITQSASVRSERQRAPQSRAKASSDRLDPEAKRRRYRKRVTERNVWMREQEDGTAVLAGSHLPPHRAAAAYDRVDRLARAARACGDARTLGQLRADALLDLVTGTPFQLAPTIDPLTADADANHDAPSGEPRPSGEPIRRPCNHSPGPATDLEPRATDCIDLYEYDRHCLTDADQWWLEQLRTTEAIAAGAVVAGTRTRYADLIPPKVLPGDRCATCAGLLPAGQTGAVEIQVKLTTLAGLDDDPALIPGFGSILPDIARDLAHDPAANPTWRWSVFAADGDLLHHGHTKHRPARATAAGPDSRFQTGKPNPDQRPCTCPRLKAAPRRTSIEIQLTPQTLTNLRADPHLPPGWADVIADIAHQIAIDTAVDQYDTLLHHGHTGRYANAVEDAFIRARDRSCRTPTCRTPASRTELDHRIEHQKGGPSHRGNLDARCKRHHVIRHRNGITITRYGTTVTLTLPNGTSFTVTLDKDVILTDE